MQIVLLLVACAAPLALGFVSRAMVSPLFSKAKSLTMSASVVELTKDGGVKKQVVEVGQGKGIEPGDILAVEYAAYVKGSNKPFAKGEKEKFVVRDGSLIKGWDVAVDSMKIGEKAKIVCSPKYGYGDKGVGDVIPANSEIEIDMKLLAWLGNQLRPESLFQKDLDIDPFIASTPEAIQAEYDDMQVSIATLVTSSSL